MNATVDIQIEYPGLLGMVIRQQNISGEITDTIVLGDKQIANLERLIADARKAQADFIAGNIARKGGTL